MTNKQFNEVVRQLLEALKKLPAGRRTSTAKLLEQLDLPDDDFGFDADDLLDLHDGLLQRARRAGLTLEMGSGFHGMDYLTEFSVK